MISTRLISVDELVARERELGSMIMEALDKGQGERNFNDYASLLVAGEAQVWVVEENEKAIAVCMTKFIHYPNYKSLHVVALTGDGWSEWGPSAHETLEVFAQETGCKKIEIWGRKGWERALKKLPQYSHAYSVFTMEI